MTRIPPIPPFDDPDDLDDDQFNTALEALLHGDSNRMGSTKLDPGMELTIDQLFDWANASGFADEPATLFSHEQQDATADAHRIGGSDANTVTAAGTQTPPTSMGVRRPVSIRSHNHDHKTRRILMSTLSGLAAAMLIGLGIYGAIPLFSPDHDPEPTSIAFTAGQGSPTATTALASGGDGNTTTTPPSTPGDGVVIGEPGANASGVDPVTTDECTVAPRSRADVLAILSSPPGSYADIVNAKNMRGPRQLTFDDIPVDELNQVFREWQACVKFGSTWQYLALETDYMIRADIYGPQSFDRGPLLEPYSQATLNDLLDGRELVDNDRRARWLEAWQDQGISLPETLLVIDQSQGAQFLISEDGTYIATVNVTKLNQVNGEQWPRNGTVDFELDNGQWMVANVSPWLEF